MASFEFRRIEALTGEKFKVLQLRFNGINQLDAFESELEESYKSQFYGLLKFINRYTETGLIPKAKFKEITPKGSFRKEFEFRTENGIRLYCVQSSDGRIIILCGYKGNQNKDILRFRGMIKRIFNS